ncbi:MAG: pirin family protein [Phycisphaerales bacterium]
MRTPHPAGERGATDIGWLKSRHTFSFGEWFDASKMGFRTLRVINDDRVAPGAGFDTHGHRDMEIVTVVLAGALTHRDSLGHEETLRPGEVQAMTAGTGIRHSEFNASRTDEVHFLQVWILPGQRGLRPSYAQRAFPAEERRGRLRRVVAGRDADRDGAILIGQDAELWLGDFRAGERATHALTAGRSAYLHVAAGAVTVDGEPLGAGDGIGIVDATQVEIGGAGESGSVLLFDLG